MVLLLLLGTGCSEESPTSTSERLVIAWPAPPRDLLPVFSRSAIDASLLANLQIPLLQDNFDCGLTWKPGLIQSWTVTDVEGNKALRTVLRSDLKWPDGVAVTAEDVRFSAELAADPAINSPLRAAVESFLPGARPKVIDSHTLEWVFAQDSDPDWMLAQISSIGVLPRHLLDQQDRAVLRAHTYNTQAPPSSGPWMVAEMDPQARLLLKPNPGYTGPPELRALSAEVEFRFIQDHAARVQALADAQVDVVEDLTVADIDQIASDHDDIVFRRRGWRAMDFIAWNFEEPSAAGTPHPLFADREVRRALAGALDMDGMIRRFYSSKVTGEFFARPAIGTLSPALCGLHNDHVARIPYDPGSAQAQLARLGWSDTNNDTWLDQGGEPFRFTLIVNQENPRTMQIADFVQANFAAVGVDAQIEKLTADAFIERLRRRDYDAALTSWSASLIGNPSVIWGQESPTNLTGYQRAELDALLAQGRTADPAARRQIWRDVQQLIYDDQPYAFLYWVDEIVGIHNRVQDASVDLISPIHDLWRWNINPERTRKK